jgi:hypothetical protein
MVDRWYSRILKLQETLKKKHLNSYNLSGNY